MRPTTHSNWCFFPRSLGQCCPVSRSLHVCFYRGKLYKVLSLPVLLKSQPPSCPTLKRRDLWLAAVVPFLQLPQTPFHTDILSRSWAAAAPLLPSQGIIWKNSLGSIASYICYEPARAHWSPCPAQGGGKHRANQNQALFSHHPFSRSLGEKRKQLWELRFPFMLP